LSQLLNLTTADFQLFWKFAYYTKFLFKSKIIVLCSIILFSCKEDDIYTDENGVTNLELSVTLTENPSGIAPLTAVINTSSTNSYHKVAITIKGKNDDDLHYEINHLKPSHRIPILGLYANHTNTIQFTAKNNLGKIISEKEFTVSTSPIGILNLPSIEILTANLAERFTLVEYRTITNKPFVFDLHGEIRWFLKFEESGIQPIVSNNSPIIFIGDKNKPKYYKYNWLGEVLNEITIPNSEMTTHHSQFTHPNGGDIIPIDTEDAIGSLICHFDESGNILKQWNMNEIVLNYLPENQDMMVIGKGWFHCNYARYDATDNSIILSGRRSIGVVKLDYNTGEIKWILGDPQKKWYQYQGLRDLALQPIGNTQLPLGQHSPIKLPNGNMLLLDNGWDGYDRKANEDGLINGGRQYSRLVEYTIDETAMTVTQVMQYGKEKGQELYSRVVGNTGYDLKVDSRYCLFGAIAYNPNSNNVPNTEGRIIEVDNFGNLLFDAKLNTQVSSSLFYRSEKIDFESIIK